MSNGSARMVNFPIKGDHRGSLIALESFSNLLPFEIKRCYYIFDTTPGTIRGLHAHRALRQILVCVSGSCTIMCDTGQEKVEFHLDWPDRAVLIEGLVWREMKNFSKGAVLLVLASEHYDEADYIRDFEAFKVEVNHA